MGKVMAGRDQLGQFAPAFTAFNDDILFWQVWADEANLSTHDCSMMTISALLAMRAFEQLDFHMRKGQENGITKSEIVALITHLAFYVRWPKA